MVCPLLRLSMKNTSVRNILVHLLVLDQPQLLNGQESRNLQNKQVQLLYNKIGRALG